MIQSVLAVLAEMEGLGAKNGLVGAVCRGVGAHGGCQGEHKHSSAEGEHGGAVWVRVRCAVFGCVVDCPNKQ